MFSKPNLLRPGQCLFPCLSAGAAALLFGFFPDPARAQTYNGLNGIDATHGGRWSDPQNWNGGAAPSNDGTADAVLANWASTAKGQGYCTLDASWNVRSLYFNANYRSLNGSGYTGGGYLQADTTQAPLTIQNGLTNASSVVLSLSPPLILGASQVWNDTGGSTIISGPISGPGGFTKTGVGLIQLLSGSTFAGGVTLVTGALAIGDDRALGSGTLTVSDADIGDVTLDALNGPRTVSNPLTHNRTNAYLALGGSDAMTYAGPIDLSGGRRLIGSNLNGAGLTISGEVSNGTLALSGNCTLLGPKSAGIEIAGGRSKSPTRRAWARPSPRPCSSTGAR